VEEVKCLHFIGVRPESAVICTLSFLLYLFNIFHSADEVFQTVDVNVKVQVFCLF